ncbi:hypothetical protein V8F20_002478 [Naviculisporaceae sp. PSN 640]
MKTTQVIAALFPLAVMASPQDGSGTTLSTSTSAPASESTNTLATTDIKELGCYKIIESNPKKTITNLLAPESNPVGLVGSLAFNARGACAVDTCSDFKYAASQGNKCFCADELDTLTLVPTSDEDTCDIGCPGYDLDKCGGASAITVYENTAKIGGSPEVSIVSTTILPYTVTSTSSGSSEATGSGTSTGTGSAPVTSKTGGPVEAGASSLVGQSVTMLVAVCGVGAALFW